MQIERRVRGAETQKQQKQEQKQQKQEQKQQEQKQRHWDCSLHRLAS